MKAAGRIGFLTALAGSLGGLMMAMAPPRLVADVVHLTNGRSMEGVVLEETPEQVLLKLSFGEIGLPRTSVSRVERGRSALQEYLERRAVLESRHAGAAAWLELAHWALREGLDHSAREATLAAARLDPGLPGLAPLMTDLGYEYEENLAVWLPRDEMMRRRGYVLSNGRWLSPEQALALQQTRDAAVESERERRRRDRLALALEMMVLAQMAEAEETRRLREEASTPRYGLPLWGGYPVAVMPGYWPRPRQRPEHRDAEHGHRSRAAESESRAAYNEAILSRPPGSLIPVTPTRSHRGRFQQPPDSH